jgi:Mce-associated membrane protein
VLRQQSARQNLAFAWGFVPHTRDVVVPGAKERQVSAVATVPAAASVSENQAVVLLFVNHTVNMDNIRNDENLVRQALHGVSRNRTTRLSNALRRSGRRLEG